MLLQARLPTGVPAMLIDCPALFNRDGGPYQDGSGRDFDDNAKRFAMLSRTAALLATASSPVDWRPDVLLCIATTGKPVLRPRSCATQPPRAHER